MEILDVLKKRRSIRNYLNKTVENDKLELILEAGRIAPSACNNQPWKFILLTGNDVKKMQQAYDREWFYTAPAIIVVCASKEFCWKRADGKESADVDAAIAMDHMILQATDLGLGTCWIGAFDEKKSAEILKIPNDFTPIAMTPIGYYENTPPTKPRKSKNEIVFRGEWGK